MHYICIENNIIISVLNYEPNVPGTVEVYAISDEDHSNILNDTHFFDIKTKQVKSHPKSYLKSKAVALENEETNAANKYFLNTTDWKILRHIRQKALSVPTSLTEEEYIALEEARQTAASNIIN
jgi:hypothetical protein